MDMYYYLKNKLELDNIVIPVQLDLSEIKEGEYKLVIESINNEYISIQNKNKTIGIITSYNNYKLYIEYNPILISSSSYHILFKKIILNKDNLLIVVKQH